MKNFLLATLFLLPVQAVSQGMAPGDGGGPVSHIAKLRVLSETKIESISVGALAGVPHCDANGNFYYWSFGPDGLFDAEITKVRIAERNTKPIRPLSLGIGWSNTMAFTVLPDGRVYTLSFFKEKPQKRADLYLLEYDKDGDFRKKIPISATISPNNLAVFPTGEFLISGVVSTKAHGVIAERGGVMLFDSGGALLRDISNPVDSDSKNTFSNAKGASRAQSSEALRAVDLGFALTGDDGFVYVFRATDPLRVFAYDSRGNLHHSFEVSHPGPDRLPRTYGMRGTKLAISFSSTQPYTPGIIRVVDRLTGELQADYSAEGFSSAILCFEEPMTFTFRSARNNKLAVVKVAP